MGTGGSGSPSGSGGGIGSTSGTAGGSVTGVGGAGNSPVVAGETCAQVGMDTGSAVLRRLSNLEYQLTLQDLFQLRRRRRSTAFLPTSITKGSAATPDPERCRRSTCAPTSIGRTRSPTS